MNENPLPGAKSIFGGPLNELRTTSEKLKESWTPRYKEIFQKYSKWRSKRKTEDAMPVVKRYLPTAEEKKKRALEVAAQAAVKRLRRFSTEDQIKVFIPSSLERDERPALRNPFESASMLDAQLVVLPCVGAMSIGNKLTPIDSDKPIDSLEMNVAMLGLRVCEPQCIDAITALYNKSPTPHIDVATLPRSIKFRPVTTVMKLSIYCGPELRDHRNTMKLLQMACSIHGCQWNIINDFEEFDRLERKARKAFAKAQATVAAKAKAKSASAKSKPKARPKKNRDEIPEWMNLKCLRLNNLPALHQVVRRFCSVDHGQSFAGQKLPAVLSR